MATIRDHAGKRVKFVASPSERDASLKARSRNSDRGIGHDDEDLEWRVFEYPVRTRAARAAKLWLMATTGLAMIPGAVALVTVMIVVIVFVYLLPALVAYRLGAGPVVIGALVVLSALVLWACVRVSSRYELAEELLCHGLCGACGYELEPAEGEGSLTTCPECGAAWRKHAKAQDAAPQPPDGMSD
ncbi:MAG: hypothetical protein KIS87_01885 [Phycisphaeraceae bacterium]|nr:hypothetical protein [Phycisphaeraceae bacterium]